MYNSIQNGNSLESLNRADASSSMSVRMGLVTASILALLSLYPQFHLWVTSNEHWQNAVAYNQGLGDEVAYAAYVNALIDGRPRKNDPYTGRDDKPNEPLPESLFSIQFVPAYLIAIPARVLGVSATTIFMFLTPCVAFLSAVAVFYLLFYVTGNNRLAAAGVFVVLCLGTFVSAEGTLSSLTGGERHFDFFPFLRRYQPAACFPFFLLFFILVWRSLTTKSRPFTRGVSVGVCLSLLIFSYLYLWTAAVAFLGVSSLLWFAIRPGDRGFVWRFTLTVGFVVSVALLPYFVLISHGPDTIRSVQALVLSRRPDLFSAAEVVGAILIMFLLVGIRTKKIDFQDSRVIFALSLAVLPFVVLNQQLITGRVLQPIHYKGFVTSYTVLLAIVITTGLDWRLKSGGTWKISKRALVWVAIAALEWGGVEAHQAARRSSLANVKGAEEMAVYRHLAQQGGMGPNGSTGAVVLFDDLRMADGAPAVSPFAVLWAPHMVVYPGVTSNESKERLYRHLYYTGVGVKELDAYFHGQNVYYGCAVGIFGFDRFIDGLNPNAKPVTSEEKDVELSAYRRYIESFDQTRAANPRLSYVVTPASDETNLSNLDRWYQRDAGRQVGKFKLFRVTLRDEFVHSSNLENATSNTGATQ